MTEIATPKATAPIQITTDPSSFTSGPARIKIDEDDAQAGHFGLWKGCFVAPQDFRHWNKRTAKLLGANCSEGAREKLFPNDPLMPAGCEIKGKYALRAYPTWASIICPAAAVIGEP